MTYFNKGPLQGIDRIIDANINRLKEGLRVCEEIARFILNNHMLTTEFKKTRHKIDWVMKGRFSDLIKSRKSLSDVGRKIHIEELKRQNIKDIFFANIQRVKESIRVLEEFAKLKDKNIALGFKKLRYNIYEIEKKVAKKITSISNLR
jgi:thiamine-phosphate pyrophosphorylase